MTGTMARSPMNLSNVYMVYMTYMDDKVETIRFAMLSITKIARSLASDIAVV